MTVFSDRERQFLARFLAEYPDSGVPAFEAWAVQQPEIAEDPSLAERTCPLFEKHLELRGLFPTGPDSTPVTLSVFRRREANLKECDPVPGTEGLCSGQRIGHFVLTRFIARGGMGQVWEAEDQNLRTTVALKFVLSNRIDKRSLELFAREARAGGQLNHPNIVRTLAHGTDEGLAWIAQELVEGSWTLADFLDDLRTNDALPKDYYPQLAHFVAQLADALQTAHDAGVIHRDVKPQNILIASDDSPKLTDFGLARVTEDSFHSVSGDFVGTFSYMSPEQVTAKRMGLDHRTDIFSLGIVLYELLALHHPFVGDTPHAIATQIITLDPPSPSRVFLQCPKELAIIAMKALEKDPARRYSSMEEFGGDLRRHLANEPILARPSGRLARCKKWIRRHPAASMSVALAVVALTVVSLLLFENKTQAERIIEHSEAQRADDYAEEFRFALQLFEMGDISRSRTQLTKCSKPQRGWEWMWLEAQLDTRIWGIEDECLLPNISSDASGSRLLVAKPDGTIQILDGATGKGLFSFNTLKKMASPSNHPNELLWFSCTFSGSLTT